LHEVLGIGCMISLFHRLLDFVSHRTDLLPVVTLNKVLCA
jgi:hypothetical protein